MKIEIKHRYKGDVIYSHECENNTILKTVEKAVKGNVSLAFADLYSADLRFANLRFANLYSADLRFANLYSANLYSANLRSADLRFANLRSAYLYSADLRFANLYSANLRSVVKMPIYCKWSHGITNGNLIHIGCEKRTIQEWNEFFDSDEEIETPRGTEEFKQIQAVYEAYKAYLTFLNNQK